MRGWWLVAGSIGLLGVAYAGDRWLWVISINVGTFGYAEGWRELGIAVALLGRLVLLIGLVVAFRAMGGAQRWALWAAAAIGTLIGILPPLVFGLHFALQPNGLPFVQLNDVTEPLWGGRATLLPWTATALLVFALARAAELGAGGRRRPIRPVALAIGAALGFVAAYAVDELSLSSAIGVASDADAYPAYMLVGLAARIGVMVAFAVLLVSVLGRAPSRFGGAALLAVGLVGFVVLPLVGLLAPPSPQPGSQTLAAILDPGTGGRWLAGATLVTGVIELVRAWREHEAEPELESRLAGGPEPA